MHYNIIRSMKAFAMGCAAVCALCLTAGCDTEYATYDGPSFIMFSDTLTVCAVQNDTEEFEIPIGATRACDHDRRVAVEVVDSLSNAIEGKHYSISSYNVVIPAGQNVGYLKLRGTSSEISVYDSLAVTLRLLCEDDQKSDLYGELTRVMLQKACPLNMDDFSGYALVTSSFLYQYSHSMSRVIRVERDKEDTLGLVLKNFFYDDYDIKVHLTDNDILNPILTYNDQRMAATAIAFGTKYGDGFLNIYQPSAYASYYSSCERFLMLFSTVYVPGMDPNYNTVGTFATSIEMISDARAEELIANGY